MKGGDARITGNALGNGWHGMLHAHGSSNVLFVVSADCLALVLLFGRGEDDPSGTLGWDTKSGNPIGNGWDSIVHVFGGITTEGGLGHSIMAVNREGELGWYHYTGQGESDLSGSTGWHPRSGNIIGTRW